ncbi:hypothetical protein D4764_20G0008620 [Takifugu flavidus]|uniref:Uncharacterized protein n=1 Tax=Takifugu flavidus TaxID=433684 RepID=A0A5C6NL64_9TELE|nr:hypothetical protein D4764_20G0008620 [Takifugu flavidus]
MEIFVRLICSPWPSVTPQTSPETSGSPPLERSSQTVSVTSVAFSLSAEEDCLLLPPTPQQPWSPDVQGTTIHCKNPHMEDDPPPSPLFTLENGDHQVSTVASHIFSALPEKILCPTNNSSDCSPEEVPAEAETDGESMLMCEMEELQGETHPFFTAENTPRLLLGAWYSSRTSPASHSSQQKSSYHSDTFQVFQLQWSGPIRSETKVSAGCEASSRQPTGQTGCKTWLDSSLHGLDLPIRGGQIHPLRVEFKPGYQAGNAFTKVNGTPGCLGSALKVFWTFPHYQNTFHVLSALGLEPTALCFSAQFPRG